ncbi:MAG TPA: prepilin-type N-terminal cleavage/methylation domain-containing protein [Candidatus Saccharimonadales bacterium]|nr:prepilin-type N-terminal cleavage/methylation domain-containing protein [Candidatus Saccharimonadales bacterium]
MLGGKNKQHRQPLGYTIVEVMIVLAVSGMMFLIAANFINGKQERAAFTQGSNDTVSKLQGVVEDITDGHYSDVPIQCVVPADNSRLELNPSANDVQGQNPDCVFLGKIMRFYAPDAGGNKTNYSLYSIAAARQITGFPDNLVGAIPNLTIQSVIPQSLYVKDMTVTDTGTPPGTHSNVFNIGFAQGIGNVSGEGVYLTGAQQPVRLIYANTTSGNESNIAGLTIQSAKSATICLTDGTRYAQILIGAVVGGAGNSNNDNQLNISAQQLGTNPC